MRTQLQNQIKWWWAFLRSGSSKIVVARRKNRDHVASIIKWFAHIHRACGAFQSYLPTYSATKAKKEDRFLGWSSVHLWFRTLQQLTTWISNLHFSFAFAFLRWLWLYQCLGFRDQVIFEIGMQEASLVIILRKMFQVQGS